MASEWVEIGTIIAPQGLKGALRVQSDSDFPERFEEPGQRWLRSAEQKEPQAVELLKGYQVPGKSIYVIELAGIEDRNQAESLRGYKLLVPQSDRPPLDVDEYHVADLMNLEVYHHLSGEKLGTVTDFFLAGNDLLEVTLLRGKKSLIPFVKAIVPVVDLKARRLEINPPAGLLELNGVEKE